MSPSRGPPSPSSSPSSSIDIPALSGILGSISIACWLIVFTPQIIENFRRSSADALSLTFIIIWLAGDVFNILGAILQGVLPTMVVLAVYYTVADLVLVGQCAWYRGWGRSDEGEEEVVVVGEVEEEERAPLLGSGAGGEETRGRRVMIGDLDRSARGSMSSFHSYISSASGGVDATHLSPATPFAVPSAAKPTTTTTTSTPPTADAAKPRNAILKTTLFNATALILVCGAGALGWYISSRASSSHSHFSNHPNPTTPLTTTSPKELHLDLWGQIFGYLCAALYLGSRIPQLLLNYRRKSTEGVSMLFFLFACVGNATYVGSIMAYRPACAGLESVGVGGWEYGGGEGEWGYGRGENGYGGWGCESGEWGRQYARYVLVNASWLIGSAGTLLLDLAIFGQFWVYRGSEGAVV